MTYLIDSDVLITAKNRYYAFPICPGFWRSLLHEHSLGKVHSIDKVGQELVSGSRDDELAQWIHESVPASFFFKSDGAEIVAAYNKVIDWVMRHERYRDAGKDKFSRGADGWLVAHGVASGKTVVTNEQSRPESRSEIKLPDVCEAFSVDYTDTFDMLHKLGVEYCFTPQR